MRIRSLFFSKIGLVFLSTLFTILLAAGGYELYARAAYRAWRSDFKQSGWVHTLAVPSEVPGMLWEYRPYGRSNNIAINRWGFRDLDYPDHNKPEGIYRIAFAGDSVTLALGLPDVKFGFVPRFEAGINAKKPSPPLRVQAMNFGIDGFNTPQVAAMVRAKVLPFHPDKVVYVMCLNDFDFTDASGLKILYFNPPGSFLFEKIEKTYIRFAKPDYHLYQYGKNREKVFVAVEDMKKRTEAAGVKFEVVILPIFPQFAANYQNYRLYGMHDDIHHRLDVLGVRYTDLLEHFRVSLRPPTYWSFDVWHPSVAGHQAIADALINAIRVEP